uniref:Uncharacterized protein n=1 Tax=Arundo donax TaxID=35708 RepID=A0A0A9BSJ2_ARUDO
MHRSDTPTEGHITE